MLNRYENAPIVGVVLVTHESACESLLGAAEKIVGTLPAVVPVSVRPGEPLDVILQRVNEACTKVNAGAGVLLLVDIHGSTPYHACMAMVDGTQPAEVLCGINLPMLIKLATVNRRELRPGEMAELLRDVGRRSIRLGSELTGKVAMEGSR